MATRWPSGRLGRLGFRTGTSSAKARFWYWDWPMGCSPPGEKALTSARARKQGARERGGAPPKGGGGPIKQTQREHTANKQYKTNQTSKHRLTTTVFMPIGKASCLLPQPASKVAGCFSQTKSEASTSRASGRHRSVCFVSGGREAQATGLPSTIELFLSLSRAFPYFFLGGGLQREHLLVPSGHPEC